MADINIILVILFGRKNLYSVSIRGIWQSLKICTVNQSKPVV